MRFLFSIIILFFLFSCKNKDKIPSGILTQNKMKEVLWDLVRADEMVTNITVRDSTIDAKAESEKLYVHVFSLHNISKEKFEKSISFYQSRPDLLKTVMDSLQNYQRRSNDETYRPRPVTDTLPFKRLKPQKK